MIAAEGEQKVTILSHIFGTSEFSKIDEFPEKIQLAFQPPATSFWETMYVNFFGET